MSYKTKSVNNLFNNFVMNCFLICYLPSLVVTALILDNYFIINIFGDAATTIVGIFKCMTYSAFVE